MVEQLPAHSPLGASSAERWMTCPGSVKLSKLYIKEKDAADPEYRTDGTAAHEAIAYCLSGSGYDAWEVIGQSFGDVKTEVTTDMADAMQVFIDKANALAAGADHTFIEERISAPDHPMFYGTVDFAAIKDGTLSILDFKYGQGIVVETENNPQIMYYAYGILQKHPDVRRVSMQIVQPRIPYAKDEPWVVEAEVIVEWALEKLFPAMKRTETDDTLVSGQHCRFCPAKEALGCPLLKQQFEEVAATNSKPEALKGMTDEELVAAYPKLDVVKMHIKAIGDEILRRLLASGLKENGVLKLVHKKANRIWKPEAVAVFKNKYGDKTMNEPEFKSPAEMEKLDAEAKKLVHEYAYTPVAGYTVADIDDKRPAAKPKSAADAFAGALDKLDPVE